MKLLMIMMLLLLMLMMRILFAIFPQLSSDLSCPGLFPSFMAAIAYLTSSMVGVLVRDIIVQCRWVLASAEGLMSPGAFTSVWKCSARRKELACCLI